MEIKDWILLIVPIICNGILLYVVQMYLAKKIERRQDIRDEVLKLFWKKLQKLNDAIIQMTMDTMKANVEGLNTTIIIQRNLITIQQLIFELTKYYDTNKFDLEQFSIYFNDFQKKWNDFQITYNQYCNIELDDSMRIRIGNKMQLVKDANQKLINEVRNKY